MDTRTPPTAHRPQVRIALDGGGTLDARIWWWLTEDGTKWALVEWNGWVARQSHIHLMCAPADRVELLDDEDYSGVIEKAPR